MPTISDLEEAALELPEPERARLARVLVLSLEPSFDEETAQVWVEEAERRADAIDRGEVETLSHDDVMTEARSHLL
jgi:putative addiction module component (TIGR02574 family)